MVVRVVQSNNAGRLRNICGTIAIAPYDIPQRTSNSVKHPALRSHPLYERGLGMNQRHLGLYSTVGNNIKQQSGMEARPYDFYFLYFDIILILIPWQV